MLCREGLRVRLLGGRAQACCSLDERRRILRRRIPAPGRAKATLGPTRDEVVEPQRIEISTDAVAEAQQLLRAHPVAVTHHVVGGRLLEQLLEPGNLDALDLGSIDKLFAVFLEPLENPPMVWRRGHSVTNLRSDTSKLSTTASAKNHATDSTFRRAQVAALGVQVLKPPLKDPCKRRQALTTEEVASDIEVRVAHIPGL